MDIITKKRAKYYQLMVETSLREPNLEYEEWTVVEWEGQFYALITAEDIDWTVNPHESLQEK